MFFGSIPALITPFDNGEIDYASLEKLVRFHVENGSESLTILGTTGENSTISVDEKKEYITAVKSLVDNKLSIIVGAGSNNTKSALEMVKFSCDIGVDGLLIVSPYYNRPTQVGVIDYFHKINEHSSLPILAYNIPQRTGMDISQETLSAISQMKNIIGVKDATSDLSRVAFTRSLCGEKFIQLSGDDFTCVGFNAMGGVGCISVVANVAPQLFSELQKSTIRGDFHSAVKIHDRLLPLITSIFQETGVSGTKYALSLLGKCKEDVRSPMVQLSEHSKNKIKDAMLMLELI